MTSTIVAVGGFVLLIVLAWAVAWQERRRPGERAIIYGVEESIEYIRPRLGPDSAAELKERDIRRILEWGVRYLQDPAAWSESGSPPVAAGLEAAMYVQEQAGAAGYGYDGDRIVEVLELQAEFLASLGAVGDPVRDDEHQQRGDS